MKKHIFIAFILFQMHLFQISAQVSVEFSVEWKKEKNYLTIPPIDTCQVVVVPYLKYTYKNSDNRDLYFQKPINTEIPMGCGILYNPIRSLEDKIKYCENYSSKKFDVFFPEFTIYKKGAEKYDSHNKDCWLNESMEAIYKIIDLQNKLDTIDSTLKMSYFNYPDRKVISSDSVYQILWKRSKEIHHWDKKQMTVEEFISSPLAVENLIFLKKGEVKTGYISLIGFYIMGGEYTFQLMDKKPFPSIYLTYYDKKKGGLSSYDIYFPPKINNYELFTGEFSTNKITFGVVK